MIVVGAGPAGSSAALTCRKAGLAVALIDKARFPRGKLCGGGITGRARGHLDAVFGPVLDPRLFHETRRLRLMAGDREIGALEDTPPLWMTMRQDFDAALLAQAHAAGVEDYSGRRIASLDVETGSAVLTDGQVLRGRVMIGADGVNSGTARALFGRAYDPRRIGFALEAELDAPADAAPRAELDLTAARWGYGWAFPKLHGVTLGIGGQAGRNRDLRPRFDAWLVARGVDPARVVVKGHHLPMGDPRPPPGRGIVLLVGDAAGFVDPITGEGIGWAVRSGQLAAEAAAVALAAAQPEQALARYLDAVAPVQRELSRARFLARVVYHPLLQQRFLNLIAGSPRIQRRFLDLMAGTIDYADLGPAHFARLGWRLVTGRG